MHEMELMREVVSVVLDFAEREGAAAVSEVYLSVGEGRDVVEEYMEGLFRHLACGTVAERADLVTLFVPMTVRCRACHRVFRIDVYDSDTWKCPYCGADRDYDLNSGMEFRIDRIVIVQTDSTEGSR